MVDAGLHVQKELMELIQGWFTGSLIDLFKCSLCLLPIWLLSGKDTRYCLRGPGSIHWDHMGEMMEVPTYFWFVHVTIVPSRKQRCLSLILHLSV